MSSPETSTHLPPGPMTGVPWVILNCWAALPLHVQICSGVPLAVLPLSVTRTVIVAVPKAKAAGVKVSTPVVLG